MQTQTQTKVVGIRLSDNVILLADSLRDKLAKDIERYPGGAPSRSDVLRHALVTGLRFLEGGGDNEEK